MIKLKHKKQRIKSKIETKPNLDPLPITRNEYEKIKYKRNKSFMSSYIYKPKPKTNFNFNEVPKVSEKMKSIIKKTKKKITNGKEKKIVKQGKNIIQGGLE